MSQTTFSIRMDDDLKKEFDKLCEEFGMSMTTAINVFARAVVREKRIPFEVMSDEVAARTQGSIDKFWAEKQWGASEINSLLDEHLRTPYKPEK